MNLDYARHQDVSFEKDSWWPLSRFALIDRVLSRFAPGLPLDVLEVGCGTGINLDYLEERHRRRLTRVVGVDPELSFFQKGIRTLRPDLPLGACFDVILVMDVLEHVDHPADLLAQLRKLLKPSGFVLIAVPAFTWLWTAYDEVAHHRRRYTLRQLTSELRSAGFNIVEDYYLFGLLFPFFVLQRLSLKLFPRQDPHLFKSVNPWVNRVLIAVMRWELRTLLPFNHVAGSSVVAVARLA